MEISDKKSFVAQLIAQKSDLQRILQGGSFAEMIKNDVSSNSDLSSSVSQKFSEAKKIKVSNKSLNDGSKVKELSYSSLKDKKEIFAKQSPKKDVSEGVKSESPKKKIETSYQEKNEKVQKETSKSDDSIVVDAEEKLSQGEQKDVAVVVQIAQIQENAEDKSFEGISEADISIEASNEGAFYEQVQGQNGESETLEKKQAETRVIQEENLLFAIEEAESGLESTMVKQKIEVKNVEKKLEAKLTDKFGDEKLVTQANELSKFVGSKKLNVSVSVDEENFSYQSKNKMTGFEFSQIVDEALNKKTDSNNTSNQLINNNSTSNLNSQINVQQVAGVSSFQEMSTDSSIVASKSEKFVGKDALVAATTGTTQLNSKAVFGTEISLADEKLGARDVYKGMAKEVVEQVKVNITKSAVKGVDKISIQLKPEDLGAIEVKMQIGKDGKLSAHIFSNKPETLEILQKDISTLQKAFSDAGFQADNQSLSFSYRQQNQENNRAELRKFIGENLDKDIDAVNYDMKWNNNGNINIRV